MSDVTSLEQRSDLEIPRAFLMLMMDATEQGMAKTGLGLVDWRPEWCVGQWRLPACGVDLGLADLTFEEALAAGVQTAVIGVAPDGGRIPARWLPALRAAINAGLNVAAGLHDCLNDNSELTQLAARRGVRLFDARRPPPGLALPVGSGARRLGRRVLTVGTDCAVGKKYTALVMERALRSRGISADFRATGQTGVLISGGGVAIDALPADFISGAVEMLSPEADPDHWDIIEGQGSLFHPSYAGVSLGLLHGAQANAFVLCHDPRRKAIDYLPEYPMPNILRCIDITRQLGLLTSPNLECVGISLNTAGYDMAARRDVIAEYEQLTGLPVTDPVAMGVDNIVDYMLSCASLQT